MKQAATPSFGYLSDKPALQTRLARIEGQVRGIMRMVDEERYCIDILTQLSAVETALRAVGLQLLDTHVNGCVAEAIKSDSTEKAAAKTAELMAAIERFSKTS